MARYFHAGVAAGLLVATTAAAAQSEISEACGWSGSEACQAERAQRAQELYNLPTVERMAADGVRVRRAFFVDGHFHVGRELTDLGVVTFSRARGENPVVAFARPREHGLTYPPITAEVPPEIWDEVLALSAFFDRGAGGGSEDSICIHPWEYNVEVGDPADPDEYGHDALARSRYDNQCNAPSNTISYAALLASRAAALFTECAPLGPGNFDYPVQFLRACSLLSGDRRTAAQVSVAASGLRPRDDEDGSRQSRSIFSEAAVLDWNGRRIVGARAAAARWRREAGPRRFLFRWDRIHAASADRAETEGVLIDVNRGRVARLLVSWIRGSDAQFLVERIVVGRFRDPRRR